jgi:hypothetical protein
MTRKAENNSSMTYITKCSVCLSYIYRYSQVFSVVSLCHAADVPSVSDFVPNPMTHIHTYGRTASVSVPVFHPNLQEEAKQKLCL